VEHNHLEDNITRKSYRSERDGPNLKRKKRERDSNVQYSIQKALLLYCKEGTMSNAISEQRLGLLNMKRFIEICDTFECRFAFLRAEGSPLLGGVGSMQMGLL
jgi:hypothetical protein